MAGRVKVASAKAMAPHHRSRDEVAAHHGRDRCDPHRDEEEERRLGHHVGDVERDRRRQRHQERGEHAGAARMRARNRPVGERDHGGEQDHVGDAHQALVGAEKRRPGEGDDAGGERIGALQVCGAFGEKALGHRQVGVSAVEGHRAIEAGEDGHHGPCDCRRDGDEVGRADGFAVHGRLLGQLLIFNAIHRARMKLEAARSFLDAGESSLQPISLELSAASSYRPAVMRASRASSQGLDESLSAHVPTIPTLDRFAKTNGDARRVYGCATSCPQCEVQLDDASRLSRSAPIASRRASRSWRSVSRSSKRLVVPLS